MQHLPIELIKERLDIDTGLEFFAEAISTAFGRVQRDKYLGLHQASIEQDRQAYIASQLRGQ